MADELGGGEHLDVLSSQLGVGQIVHAGVAFREHHVRSCRLGLGQTAPRHIQRVCRERPPDSATGSAAERHGVVVLHFHIIGGNLFYGVPRLLVYSAMAAKITGIMIGDLEIAGHPEVMRLQELGSMKHLDSGFAKL